MPRLCAMPECRKEYKKSLFPVPLFKFPKSPEIRQCWIHNINRPYWKPNTFSMLCADHFREDDFIVNVKPSPSRAAKCKPATLKEAAVPTIFSHTPTNYNLFSREDVELKLERAAVREEELNCIKRERDDFVMTFTDFKAQAKTKLNLEKYHLFENDEKCVFCLIENSSDEECMISVRISINSLLKIRILIGNSEDTRHFERLRITNNKLIKWSQMAYLLNAYRSGTTKAITANISYESLLKQALQCLKLSRNTSSSFANGERLDILINQLDIIAKKTIHPLYNSATMKMAFLLFSHSHPTLEILGKFLHLPGISSVRRMSSNMLISTNFDITTKKDRDLSDPENYVALIIDELYIDRGLKYANEKIVGTAILNPTHDPKTLLLDTKTILTFTIKSIFGDLHEIARMSPAIYPFGDVVHSHTKDALDYVQNLGFKVKLLIADTTKNSQRIFKRFSDKNHYFSNPKFLDQEIYFQFDVLHILKDIRSDWLNLVNADRTFIYPDIESFEIKNASLADLESLLESDKLNIVKKAPKLTEATLKPIDNDRHNVSLVDNIFDESTILALREDNKHGTADFCATIKKWWDIVVTDDPILLSSDQRLNYLNSFVIWLDTWRKSSSNPGRLKPSTYYAIDTTTKTIIELVEFSFTNCQAEFLHFSKLRKDSLEDRFKFYESKMKSKKSVPANSENSVESNIDVEMMTEDNANEEVEWETEYLEEENVESYKFNVTVSCDPLSIN